MSDIKPVKLEIVKAPKLKTGGDEAVAKQLGKLFADAQNGMRRIVALGLFAWEIKETQLKHGEWGPWLAAHQPKLSTIDSVTGKPKPSRALSGYLDLTKCVLESVGFPTIQKYLSHISNSQTMRICHGGKFLLLPDKKIPDEVKPLREKIFALVDGKTQRSLFMEFKQAEEDEAGELKKKHGRLKKQGGASAEQRAAAAERAERERIEDIESASDDFIAFATENADDKHLGMISDKLFGKVADAAELLTTYCKRVQQMRKGK